mgnify:CR=1 FL=1
MPDADPLSFGDKLIDDIDRVMSDLEDKVIETRKNVFSMVRTLKNKIPKMPAPPGAGK